jgi:hypothetical protein
MTEGVEPVAPGLRLQLVQGQDDELRRHIRDRPITVLGA